MQFTSSTAKGGSGTSAAGASLGIAVPCPAIGGLFCSVLGMRLSGPRFGAHGWGGELSNFNS